MHAREGKMHTLRYAKCTKAYSHLSLSTEAPVAAEQTELLRELTFVAPPLAEDKYVDE